MDMKNSSIYSKSSSSETPLERSFSKFINNAGKDGIAVVNMDSLHTMEAVKGCVPKVVTYSPSGNKEADYYVTDLEFDHGFARYKIWHNCKMLAEISLSVPGVHNVADSLCAAFTARGLVFDAEAVHYAALLHDIARPEQIQDPSLCHAKVGSEKAYGFLIII